MSGFESAYSKYAEVRAFDLVIAGIISFIFMIGFTVFDILLHDSLVLPTYTCNDPNNADLEYCKKINSATTLDTPLFEYEFGTRMSYSIVSMSIALLFPLPLAILRAKLGSQMAAFLWYVTIAFPALTGYEDYLYFALRGMDLPGEWPWLDNSLWMGVITSFANPGGHVTDGTMFLSMGLAFAIVGAVWYGALKTEFFK